MNGVRSLAARSIAMARLLVAVLLPPAVLACRGDEPVVTRAEPTGPEDKDIAPGSSSGAGAASTSSSGPASSGGSTSSSSGQPDASTSASSSSGASGTSDACAPNCAGKACNANDGCGGRCTSAACARDVCLGGAFLLSCAKVCESAGLVCKRGYGGDSAAYGAVYETTTCGGAPIVVITSCGDIQNLPARDSLECSCVGAP